MLLARYIFSQNALVRTVFGDEYDNLIAAIYGAEPERMHILASQSLRLGGWMDEASEAVAEAMKKNPESKMVLQEKKIIDNWSERMQN